MKEALTSYLGSTSGKKLSDDSSPGYGVRAMLVGTRRGDPHGGSLGFATPTDSDWPKLLRVHPIINWSYHDVWKFLFKFSVPYCSLYDAGYTSLGSMHDTSPNPALLNNPLHSQSTIYKPAHQLEDGDLERAGRGKQRPFASLPLNISPSLRPSKAFPSLPQSPPHLPISSPPTAPATGAAAISTVST
ncbi:hypothetical protein BS47DRAFT_1469919 [Hydnum rufescens UP504]|uniref:FAD synthase n=1 Tax=Hydnum rufescens UP504 TaxID=1448309 RepID=A0A9P6ATI9_9AGAM|nr:hypothetical protein BS47DRAFT_1469919 [Hydnum rufescens UP504]